MSRNPTGPALYSRGDVYFATLSDNVVDRANIPEIILCNCTDGVITLYDPSLIPTDESVTPYLYRFAAPLLTVVNQAAAPLVIFNANSTRIGALPAGSGSGGFSSWVDLYHVSGGIFMPWRWVAGWTL